MNRNISNILIFTLGAAAGAGITWKLLKTKYENIAKEEIEEVREYYSNKHKDLDKISEAITEVKEIAEEAVEKGQVRDYNDIIKKEGYVDYSEIKKEEKGEVEESFEGPVLIREDEFGDNPEYSTDTFIFYADGVLADCNGHEINTALEIVGSEYLYAIEDEDTVYVRNDEIEMYYEIIKDEGNYADLFPPIPHEE